MVSIKEIGVAMTIAVAVDATLVRCMLVPATMTLLGDLNWWSPASLRRLHARIGLKESSQAPSAAIRGDAAHAQASAPVVHGHPALPAGDPQHANGGQPNGARPAGAEPAGDEPAGDEPEAARPAR
jgi:RND superfamily putative drug exporter